MALNIYEEMSEEDDVASPEEKDITLAAAARFLLCIVRAFSGGLIREEKPPHPCREFYSRIM